MSLLGVNGKGTGAAPSAWTGKVRATGVVEPWWKTESVIAVVEIAVGQTLTLLVHVVRSSKTGRLFVSYPSVKRGEDWVPNVKIDDASLKAAIDEAATGAVLAWQAQQAPAGEADALPF